MEIIITVFKVLAYGVGGFCIGKCTRHLIHSVTKSKGKKMSNTAKRELKAKYFELCEEIVAAEGTNTYTDISVKKMNKISMEMNEYGMGKIATQEYDNMVQLYKDLGYTMGKTVDKEKKDKNE